MPHSNAFSPDLRQAQDEPTAVLLSIYDEYISGYKDRSAMVEPSYSAKLQALGNALTAIVVIDGQLVGTWKRTLKNNAIVIDTDIFRSLTNAESQAVANAIDQYAAFLQLSVLPSDSCSTQATFE
ncbi:MAG: crosslink repair DNA glycosylase YcaQ family protein [Roseiflexaceae bacterium]